MLDEFDDDEEPKPLVEIRKSSPPISKAMASSILTMAKMGMLQHHIAAIYGVNQGRVSEIVRGKRFGDVKPTPPEQLEFRFK